MVQATKIDFAGQYKQIDSLESRVIAKRKLGKATLSYLMELILNLKIDINLRAKAMRVFESAVLNGENANFFVGSLLNVVREKHRVLSPSAVRLINILISRETNPVRLRSWVMTLRDFGVVDNVYSLSIMGKLKMRLVDLASGNRITLKQIEEGKREVSPPERILEPHKSGKYIPGYKLTGKRRPTAKHFLG